MINPVMIFTVERYYITFDSISYTLISYLWHLFCNWKFGSFKKLFNLRIIALQNCVGFCHTSTWISHRQTYVPSLLNLLPTVSHPSRLSQGTNLSSLSHTANSHWLFIYFTYGNIYTTLLPSQFISASSASIVSTSLFPMSFLSIIAIESLWNNLMGFFFI